PDFVNKDAFLQAFPPFVKDEGPLFNLISPITDTEQLSTLMKSADTLFALNSIYLKKNALGLAAAITLKYEQNFMDTLTAHPEIFSSTSHEFLAAVITFFSSLDKDTLAERKLLVYFGIRPSTKFPEIKANIAKVFAKLEKNPTESRIFQAL
ncbi:unnamed protein product, partial [marine sediment metagenome]